MKKTVLEYFNDLPEGEFKTFVMDNLDTRYVDSEVYCLNYALTFGVNCPKGKEDWNRIEEFIKNNK